MASELDKKETMTRRTDLMMSATSEKFEGVKKTPIPILLSAHSSAIFFQKTLRGECRSHSSVLGKLLSIWTGFN